MNQKERMVLCIDREQFQSYIGTHSKTANFPDGWYRVVIPLASIVSEFFRCKPIGSMYSCDYITWHDAIHAPVRLHLDFYDERRKSLLFFRETESGHFFNLNQWFHVDEEVTARVVSAAKETTPERMATVWMTETIHKLETKYPIWVPTSRTIFDRIQNTLSRMDITVHELYPYLFIHVCGNGGPIEIHIVFSVTGNLNDWSTPQFQSFSKRMIDRITDEARGWKTPDEIGYIDIDYDMANEMLGLANRMLWQIDHDGV